ncbi:MAG: hypothetical protein AAF382_05670 [Pseudomonadota bacterium]
MIQIFEVARHVTRALVFLLVAVVALHTPAFADRFDEKWQKVRTYYVEVVNAGCAGDLNALSALERDALSPYLSSAERSVAAHMMAWALHPVNSCPPFKQHQSESKWRLWISRAADGGYPTSLYAFGRSQVEGTYGVRVDKRAGLHKLRTAERRGSNLAAMFLGKYYLNADYGIAPDKFFARWYLSRAETLGGTSANLPRYRELAEKMSDSTTDDALAHRLEGMWTEGSGGIRSYRIKGREITVSSMGPGLSPWTVDLTLDWGTCPNVNGSKQRLRLRDECYLLEWKSPNELVTDSEDNKAFDVSPTKRTWFRIN